jgi:hypothetical protein
MALHPGIQHKLMRWKFKIECSAHQATQDACGVTACCISRLAVISEGWLQRMRVAAPFMNVTVAVQSLVSTDWSLYLRVGYKEWEYQHPSWMYLLQCSPWLLQIGHFIWRMVTKNESSSTLHECNCCCVVPGYYRLVTLPEGWLQRMRVAAPFMNVPVAV